MALIANPQAYDGKRIVVEGYFDGSHFEDCRLFLSKGDFDHYIARNSIWVRWPGCFDRRSATRVQRRYAAVEGVFQADIGANFGSFSAIRDIKRLEPMRSPVNWGKTSWLTFFPWLPIGILFVAATTLATYLIARRVGRR